MKINPNPRKTILLREKSVPKKKRQALRVSDQKNDCGHSANTPRVGQHLSRSKNLISTVTRQAILAAFQKLYIQEYVQLRLYYLYYGQPLLE